MKVGVCIACGEGAGPEILCADCDARARAQYLSVSGDGTGNYDEHFFAILERLEPKSFWFRSRNELIVWAMRSYCEDLHRFLEVGCGTGFVLAAIRRRLPDVEVWGADLFAEGLHRARRRLPGVRLLQLDATDLRLTSSFDAVAALDVLEHIEDDELVLRQLAQAVRPGGALLLTVPQHPRLWSAADEFAHHVRRYARPDLLAKARRAGWQPRRVTSFVSLSLPFLVLSRGLRHRKTYSLEQELNLWRPLDASLAAVMAVERRLLGLGVDLPVGASLLLVAHRVA